jgi:hypothetical protein
MFAIRKFVGYTGAAAGIGAAIALAMSTQTGLASASTIRMDEPETQFTPSPACTAAINAIKADFKADAAEDNAERMAARANPTAGETPGEDAAEIANLRALFTAAKTACAPAVTAPAPEPKFTPSAQCVAAIAALKAAWAQGRPTTLAQWQHLQALAVAVRNACGWRWADAR